MAAIPGCGIGGWTLVMKTNGNEVGHVFEYSTKHWQLHIAPFIFVISSTTSDNSLAQFMPYSFARVNMWSM
jgi:hypothetical protein